MRKTCKILFYIGSPVHFKLFVSYYKILKHDFIIECILDNSHHDLKNEAGFFLKEGLNVIKAELFDGKEKKILMAERLMNRFYQLLFPGNLINSLQEYRSRKEKMRAVFKQNQADLFICFEDNHGIVLSMINYFNKNGVNTLVLPYTISNEDEWGFCYSKLNEFIVSGRKKEFFYSIFRKWKSDYGNVVITCDKPEKIFARLLLGLNPKNPWIPIGGRSKYVLFESDFIFEYYRRNRMPGKKVLIAPIPSFDSFYMAKNKADALQKDPAKVVLCSLPPDYYENIHFTNYNDMLESWVNILSRKGIRLILSLHPRIKYEDVKFLEKPGTVIVLQPIEELIPLCDIFVASVSATIRYALTNEKIILNFDMYGMNYSEYNGIASVVTVFDKSSFIYEYEQILSGSYDKKAAQLYAEKKGYFGKVTGETNQTIKNVIAELC